MPQFRTRVRRIKFWWHLFLAYLKRYQLRILITFVIIVTAILGVYKSTPLIFRNNVVSMGYVGAYTIETLPTEVLSQATKPLISKDNSGRSVPALASHWTTQEEGKVYIVFLKDNLKWHDETPVEAKDISLAIKNVEVIALNNKTLQFKLPNPISSFPQALDTPVFKKRSFYGTGNFRITNISEVDGIVKTISLVPSDPKLPTIDIKFYQTEELAQNALKIGEIKVLSLPNAKQFEGWQNLRVEKEIDKDSQVTIFYNNQDSLLSAKEARQALSYAITRENLEGQIANSPISFSSWAYNPDVKKYEYNTAKAKEFLSKTEIKNPKVILSYIQGLEKDAQKIKEDWGAIGIAVELKEEKGVPKDFQALLAINKLPPDPDQYALWHSTQKETNITKYVNVKIDKLLEDARATEKENERRDLYFDFQRFLAEDEPATFLYHPYKYTISYRNIEKLLAKLPQN